MKYIVDFIETKDIGACRAAWSEAASNASAEQDFARGTLYRVIKPIRNTHYHLVSVVEWASLERNPDIIARSTSGQFEGYQPLDSVERTVCESYTTLGQFTEISNANVFMINPFEIGIQQENDVLKMWRDASKYMTSRPGFINARFCRTVDPHSKYRFVNISEWESEESFMVALADSQYSSLRKQSHQYSLHPSLCERVATVPTNECAGKRLGIAV